MATIYDIDPNELIEKAGLEFKKLGIKKPSWSDFVKTGRHKERPPANTDWWYFRLAAILRSVYKLGPIGVSKLRTKYGGRKNRGHKPDKVFRGSGSIIRKALQQLEENGFVKKIEKDVHKGRIITPKGTSFLDKIASQIYKPRPKVKIEAAPKKQEKKPKKQVIKEQKKEPAKQEAKEVVKKQPQEPAKQETKEVVKKPDNLPKEKPEQQVEGVKKEE